MKKFSLLPVGALLLCAGLGVASAQPRGADADSVRRVEAQQSYSIGQTYYQQGNYDAALENFERAAQIDSTYPDPHIAIGNIWKYRRDMVQAKEHYLMAIELDPAGAKGYEALGDFYLTLSRGDTTYRDSAVALYETGLQKDSTVVELYLGLAEVYVAVGRVDLADSVFAKALQTDAENEKLLRLWGEFNYDQGRYEAAVRVLGPLADEYPELLDIAMMLAGALAELKRYDEALVRLDAFLAVDSASTRAHLTKGAILSRKGKLSDAVAEFDIVIGLDSADASAHYYKGDALVRLGRLSAAETSFRAALALDAGMASAQAGLGDVYRQWAVGKLGTTITGTPTADLEAAKGFFQSARSWYEKARSDAAMASYANKLIENIDQNLDAVERELFIRGD